MGKVYREGLKFSGSLVTGPTCNYLSVTFSKSAISIPKYHAYVQRKETLHKEIIQNALLEHEFPTENGLYPSRIDFREDDTPSINSYRRLLHQIIAAASALNENP